MQPSFLHEPARDIPVCHECDICVIGGSCTGVFAAVCAARLGASVAIVEKHNCFGGTATASLVNVWHSLYDTERQTQIIAGLTQEMMERLQRQESLRFFGDNTKEAFAFNSEELKIELDQVVCEAGVKPFLHTLFVHPWLEGGSLQAVVIENKSGRSAIKASLFIDASGDGDLAARSGLPTNRYEYPQPATMCAHFGGWETLGDTDWGATLREHGKCFDLPEGFAWGTLVPDTGSFMLAGTRLYGLDSTNAESLTTAEMEGRRQVRAIRELLRSAIPTSKVVLRTLPACIGLRDSRHVRCQFTLTGEDVLNGRRFPDAIANGSYPVDIHHQEKPGITFRNLNGRERYCRPGYPVEERRWREPTDANPTFYQIPLCSLIPARYDNLLIAGRILDADAVAFGAVRVMVNCNQMGEAAGTAAWLALDTGTPVQHLEPMRVRQLLEKGGSIIL